MFLFVNRTVPIGGMPVMLNSLAQIIGTKDLNGSKDTTGNGIIYAKINLRTHVDQLTNGLKIQNNFAR